MRFVKSPLRTFETAKVASTPRSLLLPDHSTVFTSSRSRTLISWPTTIKSDAAINSSLLHKRTPRACDDKPNATSARQRRILGFMAVVSLTPYSTPLFTVSPLKKLPPMRVSAVCLATCPVNKTDNPVSTVWMPGPLNPNTEVKSASRSGTGVPPVEFQFWWWEDVFAEPSRNWTGETPVPLHLAKLNFGIRVKQSISHARTGSIPARFYSPSLLPPFFFSQLRRAFSGRLVSTFA